MKVRTCKICGDTAPEGKDLCWCCEHAHKLHPMNPKQCDHDKCEIDFGGKSHHGK